MERERGGDSDGVSLIFRFAVLSVLMVSAIGVLHDMGHHETLFKRINRMVQ